MSKRPEKQDPENSVMKEYLMGFNLCLKEFEEYFISEALEKAKGNQSIASQLLGISQSTLSRRLSGKTG